jgi:DNA-binding protein YbaB/biotin operon repressor
MSDRRKRKLTENLNRCYKVVLQSSSKGISAVDIAKQLGVHRTTVHSYLNTLELMGRVYSEHGLWYAKTENKRIKPVESEIVIELPIPKNQWAEISALEAFAKLLEKDQLTESAETIKILLENLRKTRTIKIESKNMDNLDLEKLQSLILQAYERSSKVKSSKLSKIFRGIRDGAS